MQANVTVELSNAKPEAATVADVSPKQPSARHLRDWYPYYAGFTERFVDAVVQDFLQGARSVIDPWSGSGTTTVVCLRRGIASSGVDVNPATTVIARARLNPESARERLLDTAACLVERARTMPPTPRADDLLGFWMAGGGVAEIRALVQTIRDVLDQNLGPQAHELLRNPGPSHPASFFYTACFAVVRGLLGRYGTTNPTWIKRPRTLSARIRPSRRAVRERFLQEAARLAGRLSLTEAHGCRTLSPFKTGTASDTGFPDDSFDAAITSPPYATRVDYIRGSLPELAVLGADERFVERLRSASTGSPKVRGVTPSDDPMRSDIASELLEVIEHHSSKGSQSYYHPWMANYLHALQAGLVEADRVVTRDGTICVVMQDSYFKEAHVDMQAIVTEILAASGRVVVSRHDYPAPNPRRRRAAGHASRQTKRPCTESLLVFRCPEAS